MKNKKLIIIILLILVVLSLLYKYVPSLELKTGIIQSSVSLEYAKEIGVFRARYEPTIKKLNIGNTQLHIIEAWNEQLWSYKDVFSNIDTHEGSEFCVRFEREWLYSDSIKFSSPDSESIGFTNHQVLLSDCIKDTIELNIEYDKPYY